MKRYVISSGHGDKVSGAVSVLNEVIEAKKVTKRVHAILIGKYGGKGKIYHETTASNQAGNLENIVDYHNSQVRDLDISVHFNAAASNLATGTECLYYDAKGLSAKMSKAMSDALRILNRGAKERKELYFLKKTNKTAILLEVCFVSSQLDAQRYKDNFEALCHAIAKVIADELSYTEKKVVTTSDKAGNTSKYYTGKDLKGLYRIIKNCYQYSTIKCDKSDRLQPIKKGEAITATEIVKYGSAYRLKTKHGYVTANKEYVQKV